MRKEAFYLCAMDFEFESRWKKLIERLEAQFGEALEVEGILFLIGVQELGQGRLRFPKDEKLNLMHIAICAVLEPFGFYAFSHFDEERWPHYEMVKSLPHLTDSEQKLLMRKAIVTYFESATLIPE